ncbi:MAG TPA: efflux RND transporter periplasmic adaptor subunit [Dokdonella sp.]
MRHFAIGIAVLPALLAAALAACTRSSASGGAPAPAPAPEVSVAQVLARPLRDWQEFTGRLEAIDSVQVQPRVSGVIDSAPFVEGARVKKGQLLFRIDPRPFRAEVDRLAAALKHARSASMLAASNEQRGKRLVDQHMISQQDYDQLTTAASTSADDIGSAEAALEAARLNLEFTEVRAPIDGRVSRKLITPGNLVTPASVLTTVVSDDPVYAYFDADEQTYLHFARTASTDAKSRDGESVVYMGLIDENGYPHEGRLDFLDNALDAQSGTIRGRAVFDNHDGRFTPGLFARIKLVGGAARDTILIDERAVGTDLGKKFVLALKPDDTLEYRLIELGAALDGLRIVKQGLAAGDVVVVNGLQHVKPGIAVKPIRVEMDATRAGVAQVSPRAPTTPVLVAGTAADARR